MEQATETRVAGTTAATDSHRRVRLVGAFERDNFGDELFRSLTAAHLAGEHPDWDIAPAGPFVSRIVGGSGAPIHRLADLDGEPTRDGTWVVGGEVGGTSLLDAFMMSTTDRQFQRYLAASPRDRRRLVAETAGVPFHASPYLPRRRRTTEDALGYVINSVGLAGVLRLRGRALLNAVAVLREADYISVRDRRSSRVLRALGIKHRLAPDLVHVLERGDDRERDPAESVALVQIRAETLSDIGLGDVARQLASVTALKRFEVALFSAGTARNHDSRELYESLQDRLIKMGIRASIDDSVDAESRVRAISRAGLWVGTSLHGSIVASALGTPRVALDNIKVSRYAQTWSDPMPWGVGINRLESAIDYALSGPAKRAARLHQAELKGGATSSLYAGMRALAGIR